METIKDFFNSTWAKVSGGLAIVLGIVWYFLSLKNKQVAALQAKVDLADTEKKSDLIEAEIKQKMDQVDMLKKEQDEHQKLLDQIEEKRKNLPSAEAGKTNKEIEDYWNNK